MKLAEISHFFGSMVDRVILLCITCIVAIVINNPIMSGYSQQDEFEADRLAVKYTKKAGYDPNEMMFVLELLREEMLNSPRRPIAMFRSHPHLNERMAALNKELKGKVEFRDYLNLTEEEGF